MPNFSIHGKCKTFHWKAMLAGITPFNLIQSVKWRTSDSSIWVNTSLQLVKTQNVISAS